jgi:hypothetical protein
VLAKYLLERDFLRWRWSVPAVVLGSMLLIYLSQALYPGRCYTSRCYSSSDYLSMMKTLHDKDCDGEGTVLHDIPLQCNVETPSPLRMQALITASLQ